MVESEKERNERHFKERLEFFERGFTQGYLKALKQMSKELWDLALNDSEADSFMKMYAKRIIKEREEKQEATKK